jgi:hypothetical protein
MLVSASDDAAGERRRMATQATANERLAFYRSSVLRMKSVDVIK